MLLGESPSRRRRGSKLIHANVVQAGARYPDSMAASATSKAVPSTEPVSAREAWLSRLAEGMASWFVDLGHPLPTFRIVSGFPSGGERGHDVAEVWSDDGGASYTILVRPDTRDRIRLAAGLAHKLARIAAGPDDTDSQVFRRIAVSVGLRGRKTEEPPGALFRKLAKPVLRAVGPLPPSPAGPPDALRRPKQSTRLVKVSCARCGYVARVSRKWLDQSGPPHCPDHGAMERDG